MRKLLAPAAVMAGTMERAMSRNVSESASGRPAVGWSWTLIVTRYWPSACGVQVSTPVWLSMAAPRGSPSAQK